MKCQTFEFAGLVRFFADAQGCVRSVPLLASRFAGFNPRQTLSFYEPARLLAGGGQRAHLAGMSPSGMYARVLLPFPL